MRRTIIISGVRQPISHLKILLSLLLLTFLKYAFTLAVFFVFLQIVNQIYTLKM